MGKQKIIIKQHKCHLDRGRSEKIVELKTTLGGVMVKMACHFDLAFNKFSGEMGAFGYFSTKEGRRESEVLIENAQQAILDFSDFMSEFCKKVGFDYNPPKEVLRYKHRPQQSEDDEQS